MPPPRRTCWSRPRRSTKRPPNTIAPFSCAPPPIGCDRPRASAPASSASCPSPSRRRARGAARRDDAVLAPTRERHQAAPLPRACRAVRQRGDQHALLDAARRARRARSRRSVGAARSGRARREPSTRPPPPRSAGWRCASGCPAIRRRCARSTALYARLGRVRDRTEVLEALIGLHGQRARARGAAALARRGVERARRAQPRHRVARVAARVRARRGDVARARRSLSRRGALRRVRRRVHAPRRRPSRPAQRPALWRELAVRLRAQPRRSRPGHQVLEGGARASRPTPSTRCRRWCRSTKRSTPAIAPSTASSAGPRCRRATTGARARIACLRAAELCASRADLADRTSELLERALDADPCSRCRCAWRWWRTCASAARCSARRCSSTTCVGDAERARGAGGASGGAAGGAGRSRGRVRAAARARRAHLRPRRRALARLRDRSDARPSRRRARAGGGAAGRRARETAIERWLLVARSARATGDRTLAADALDRAVALAPDRADVQRLQAERLLADGDIDGAERCVEVLAATSECAVGRRARGHRLPRRAMRARAPSRGRRRWPAIARRSRSIRRIARRSARSSTTPSSSSAGTRRWPRSRRWYGSSAIRRCARAIATWPATSRRGARPRRRGARPLSGGARRRSRSSALVRAHRDAVAQRAATSRAWPRTAPARSSGMGTRRRRGRCAAACLSLERAGRRRRRARRSRRRHRRARGRGAPRRQPLGRAPQAGGALRRGRRRRARSGDRRAARAPAPRQAARARLPHAGQALLRHRRHRARARLRAGGAPPVGARSGARARRHAADAAADARDGAGRLVAPAPSRRGSLGLGALGPRGAAARRRFGGAARRARRVRAPRSPATARRA